MYKKKIIQIVAKNALNYIGKNGKLMYNLPKDMERFKKFTEGYAVIMGHNTYNSLKKPLKNRMNIVISTEKFGKENVVSVDDLDTAIALAESLTEWGNKIFIIGGGKIYEDSLELSDELYITEIKDTELGDVNYPSRYKDLFKEILTEGITSSQIDGDYITSYQHWVRNDND